MTATVPEWDSLNHIVTKCGLWTPELAGTIKKETLTMSIPNPKYSSGTTPAYASINLSFSNDVHCSYLGCSNTKYQLSSGSFAADIVAGDTLDAQ